jgi:hypothetical protein
MNLDGALRGLRRAELMTIVACRAFLAASGLTSGSGFSSAQFGAYADIPSGMRKGV